MADRTPAPDTPELHAAVISCGSRNPSLNTANGLLLSQESTNAVGAIHG